MTTTYLYLIERIDGNLSHDEYDSHVIAATHPDFVRAMAADRAADEGERVWLRSDKSRVTRIGISRFKTDRVVLSSFIAG